MNQISSEKFKELLHDEMKIMFGGFMGNGAAHNLIELIKDSNINNIYAISNDAGLTDYGLGKLISTEQISLLKASHIGLNPSVAKRMAEQTMVVELVPQGTLVECIRAGGFGLGAVVTPTGVGTILEKEDNTLIIDGRKFLVEKPITADLAVIYGTICDKYGNVKYKGTTQNFNTQMAMASSTVVMEVEKIIDDVFDPNEIIIPHNIIDYYYVKEGGK